MLRSFESCVHACAHENSLSLWYICTNTQVCAWMCLCTPTPPHIFFFFFLCTHTHTHTLALRIFFIHMCKMPICVIMWPSVLLFETKRRFIFHVTFFLSSYSFSQSRWLFCKLYMMIMCDRKTTIDLMITLKFNYRSVLSVFGYLLP